MRNLLFLRNEYQKAKPNNVAYRRIIVSFELPKKHRGDLNKRQIVSFCKSCLLMKQ